MNDHNPQLSQLQIDTITTYINESKNRFLDLDYHNASMRENKERLTTRLVHELSNNPRINFDLIDKMLNSPSGIHKEIITNIVLNNYINKSQLDEYWDYIISKNDEEETVCTFINVSITSRYRGILEYIKNKNIDIQMIFRVAVTLGDDGKAFKELIQVFDIKGLNMEEFISYLESKSDDDTIPIVKEIINIDK